MAKIKNLNPKKFLSEKGLRLEEPKWVFQKTKTGKNYFFRVSFILPKKKATTGNAVMLAEALQNAIDELK